MDTTAPTVATSRPTLADQAVAGFAPSVGRGWRRRLLARLLAVDRLDEVYAQLADEGDSDCFLEAALTALGVSFVVAAGDVATVPAEGPLVVVANHPFGGVEGLVLARLLRGRRADVKLMANHLLSAVPQLASLLIEVDPFGHAGSTAANVAGLRRTLRWLGSGGAVVVFPAGAVAHLHLRQRAVLDPPWSDTVARLVKSSGATVLPVHVAGGNGALFQVAGLIHPALRTALLPRQLVRPRRQEVQLRLGTPISATELAALDDTTATRFLRTRTELLGADLRATMVRPPAPLFARPVAVASQRWSDLALADEVRRLPAEQELARSGGVVVSWARASQIPALLHEIGRWRELSFRAAGEGTGHELDLDRFDQHYLHLFAWDEAERRLVGAYRLAESDEVAADHGLDGLYTSSLFRLDRRLLRHLGPALELGRSFVRPEYQRSMAGLPLLWKGIGRFVGDRPRCRHLFGPVSISAAYRQVSVDLIVAHLRHYHRADELAALVQPRFPPVAIGWEVAGRVRDLARSMDQLESWVRHVEHGARGVPTLVRQYVKLGGRFAAFNVDPDFSDVVDGLVVVDLAATDQRTLGRFMGADQARAFAARHAGAAV